MPHDDFQEGSRDRAAPLGGKGANLAEVTNLGLPAPLGFAITTDDRGIVGVSPFESLDVRGLMRPACEEGQRARPAPWMRPSTVATTRQPQSTRAPARPTKS
ncbi:hypothetical protein AB0H00_27290 [Nocardia sp. NPDC023852]|uniref:hypothetical protein n=1 Tax=Nocardia sp. NPDC023852 TaxID=3154697 RepID=UPI00340D650F